MTTAFEQARAVADAVLYEGYLLYPYRASAAKNRSRWQFGVLVPPVYACDEAGEYSETQTECVVEAPVDAKVHVRLRFLHVQERQVEDRDHQEVESLTVDDHEVRSWDEAVEYEEDLFFPIEDLMRESQEVPMTVASAESVEDVRDGIGRLQGRTVRRRHELRGTVLVRAEPIPGPYGGMRLRVVVRNTTGGLRSDLTRDEAVRRSFVAAHVLLGVSDGTFVSQVEPPEWAKPMVEQCENIRCWPVLLGSTDRSDAVLSAPIILYDNPTIAPESPQPLFDGTEIDEILTLRTLALTDEEKREARNTDEYARVLIDQIDDMPVEVLERLHGTLRSLRSSIPQRRQAEEHLKVPWWDQEADAAVCPETDSVVIDGVAVAKDSKVRLNPGHRRADAQDMFLKGRIATVQGVYLDVDGEQYLAVTIDGDPAADVQATHGRYRYFFTDEVDPITGSETTS